MNGASTLRVSKLCLMPWQVGRYKRDWIGTKKGNQVGNNLFKMLYVITYSLQHLKLPILKHINIYNPDISLKLEYNPGCSTTGNKYKLLNYTFYYDLRKYYIFQFTYADSHQWLGEWCGVFCESVSFVFLSCLLQVSLQDTCNQFLVDQSNLNTNVGVIWCFSQLKIVHFTVVLVLCRCCFGLAIEWAFVLYTCTPLLSTDLHCLLEPLSVCWLMQVDTWNGC